MKLAVYVGETQVATLESLGDFKSVLSYVPNARDLVSLTMPVRTESYVWDDQVHPFFQMNLPEGYLLQALQEQFGPHVGASPLSLLAIVGRNTLGRVRVVPDGAPIQEPPRVVDLQHVLRGDNSESAFADLVREHATSGVSGVVPKFLDAALEKLKKVTLLTHRHIVKGSSSRLPHVALNEHFSMAVARRVTKTASTQTSDDGNVLVVDRFDVDERGQPRWAMEDFCALLGLRPAQKYETTWERIAKAVRDHVRGAGQTEAFEALTATLLLTYALRNADCHAKNIALLYTSRDDAQLSPVFDMVTTAAYHAYANNPPGIAFLGKKTWLPGKHLRDFIARVFGVPPRKQVTILESISDAVSAIAPDVRRAMKHYPAFNDLGKQMLVTWRLGIDSLRDARTYGIAPLKHVSAMEDFSEPRPRPKKARSLRTGSARAAKKRR